MKKANKFLVSIVASVLSFAFPVSVLAQNTGAAAADDGKIQLKPPSDTEFANVGSLDFPTMVSGLIQFLLVVASVVFFFVLVIGGIQWIVSGGDKAGTENARKRITAALIGLVIVFSAWAIASIIGGLFNIPILDGLSLPSFINNP